MKAGGRTQQRCYRPTFKKAILVHVAVDVDVLASSKRKLCLWVFIGALERVVAVEGGAEKEEDLQSVFVSRLLSPIV